MKEPLGINTSEGVSIEDVAQKEKEPEFKIVITPKETAGIHVHVDGWDVWQAQIVLANAIEAVRKEVIQQSKIVMPKGRRMQ